MCDACHRVGPDPRRMLPADFYDREPIVAALAVYDFGPFFLTVRGLTGWSQQTLGGVVGLEQSQISAIERGESQLRNIELIAGVAHGLATPPVLLNFPDISATVGAAGVAGRKVASWMDRRDFTQHIAGLVLGIAGATGLDINRLTALLPQAESTGTRHVGAADVAVIEHVTAAFRRQDWTHGSGLVRDAAVAQLQSVLPLLDAQVSPDVRPRLLVATADLAMQAGWMSFDVLHHDAARRLWMIGLDVARDADHPQAGDLTVNLLYDLVFQALHLGRQGEARHLVQIGHATASSRTHLVSTSTSCLLANIQARVHAAQGDGSACDRALGQATEQFAATDPAGAGPWVASFNDASLAALQGHAHYTLASVRRDPRAAGRAVPLLRDAVGRYGLGKARVRAHYLTDLVGAHALAGDIATAVTLGHQAVETVAGLSSPRLHNRLRTLNSVLEPLDNSPGVADLRGRLAATAA